MSRVLYLTLHREWFDAIARGDKREEYRAMSPHWRRKFGIVMAQAALPGEPALPWDVIEFRNGYQKRCPWMRVELLGIEEGTWQGQPCFVLKLGRVLEKGNWP
jgi:hypothetical protein